MNENYLIVGGTSGIGEKVVETILGRQEGDSVFITSRGPENYDSINQKCLRFDASDEEFDARQIPESLHGLVYCPGTVTLKPFSALNPRDYFQDYQVNLLGAVKVIKACLKKLKNTSRPSSIVLFSSVAASKGFPYHASIASAKGAVEALTRSLAAELSPLIRVNAIAPSLTQTPLVEKLIDSEQKLKSAESRHPMRRVGRPDDIANMTVNLLKDSSSWVTGQVFHVDGGLSTLSV